MNQNLNLPKLQVQESVLAVTHEENGKKITRTYDFRSSTARHAYIRFTSWALANHIAFKAAPARIEQV